MARFTTAEMAMLEGKTVRRSEWPDCKVIRYPQDADNDFFMHLENKEGLIVEDCKKVCDCSIGVWIPAPEDKEADDWIILNN